MSKKEKQDASARPLPKKRPGSFVWKLTLRQMLRMVCMLLTLNFIIILIWGANVAAVTGEAAMDAYSREASGSQGAQASVFSPEMEVRRSADLPAGSRQLWRVPYIAAEMPTGTYLDLQLHPDWRNLWREWGGYARYTLSIPLEGDDYLVIAFDLSGAFSRFARGMWVLVCAEGVLLLFSSWGVRKTARKTLAPIRELTQMAYSIGVEPPRDTHRKGQPQEELQLSGTINTLNTITAKRLDTRLQIAGEREELRGLASAINSMLDRLDAAYQSQLRFVSDASHELRTPIAVIQGYANLLDRWGKDDPAALQESIDAIKAEAQSMQVLVEQLLFLARSDNNSIVINPETLDISALAAEVLRDSQVIDGAHNFLSHIAPDLWSTGDSGLIKQALRIFMDNAIKYTPAGERITVSAARDGEWVKLAVTDNGIGIPDEDLTQVFERFFRSDESRTRKTGGTGLGLSIAKWIVHRHGGQMDILSRKDAGTRLTMLLPASVPPPPEPSEAENECG